MKDLWLLPLLLCSGRNTSTVGELSKCLNLPSSRTKTLVYYAVKAGYLRREGRAYALSDKGMEFLKAFEVLERKGNKLKVKGRDGCFLVFVRKKNVKVLRVPCS